MSRMLTLAECAVFRRAWEVEFPRVIALSTTSINDSMVMSLGLILASGNRMSIPERRHAEMCYVRALAADASMEGLSARLSIPLFFDEQGVYCSRHMKSLTSYFEGGDVIFWNPPTDDSSAGKAYPKVGNRVSAPELDTYED